MVLPEIVGGDKGNRTPDLVNANHALSQQARLHTPKEMHLSTKEISFYCIHCTIYLIIGQLFFRTFVFCSALRYNVGERRRDAVKYTKQPKRHIYLDDFEWRALIKGVNEYRKQVIDELGCVEVVNDLLQKIVKAPTKRIKIMEESK